MACIHCGLCLSSCPTYLETGNENNSPRGRIYLMRALQSGRMALGDEPVRHLDLCLGCRACEAACPSGVEYGQLLETTRQFVETNYRRSLFQQFLRRLAIEKVFPVPWRLKLALWPARWLRRFGIDQWLPRFARESLSLVPRTTSSEVLPVRIPAAGPKKGEVGFVSGCVMQVMFGETNRSSAGLLAGQGYEVFTPAEQGCCGALFAHGGNLEEARACARRNIAAFETGQVDAIIINAAGCGSTLKEYGHLLAEDSEFAERAKAFSAKVRDITEWLVEQGYSAHPAPVSSAKVTYHDACHLAHAQRITKPPRQLVRSAAGAGFVELPEADICCGSAGTYNLTEPEMAERLQQRKIANILGTGAGIVVTSNPGCILQIQAGLEKAGASHIRVMHISDFLAAKQSGGTPG